MLNRNSCRYYQEEMLHSSELKLVDLLALKPGTLLRLHSVKGETECLSDSFARLSGWQDEFSHAIFPNGDPQKIHNLSKLLDVPIDFQIIIRHSECNVIEVHRLMQNSWHSILKSAGCQADIMVDGRIIAQGLVVNDSDQSGILILKLAFST
jgi:flagellar motor switch/type III secretory pathway protein FliN